MIDGYLSTFEVSEFLDIKETTVCRWFAKKIEYYHDLSFVEFGIFIDHLFDYRNGYYMKRLMKKYETVGEDENEVIRSIMQSVLSNCRLFFDVTTCEADEDLVKVIGHKGLEARLVFM